MSEQKQNGGLADVTKISPVYGQAVNPPPVEMTDQAYRGYLRQIEDLQKLTRISYEMRPK